MLCEHCKVKIDPGTKACPTCGKSVHPGCWLCAGGSMLCCDCHGDGELVKMDGFFGLLPLRLARKLKGKAPSITCARCQGTGIDPLLCPICLGTGKPKPVIAPCPVCNGTGIEICRSCGGSGKCRGGCREGDERCPDCEGKGCEACGSTGKLDCMYCNGSGCSRCDHSGRYLCHYCKGLGRCTECSGGEKACLWCDPADRKADIMEVWDRGFHQSERNGDVGEIMFYHRLVAPYLDQERKGLILKYIEKRLVPCGFPKGRMEELKSLLN